jgi:hypothetical protein
MTYEENLQHKAEQLGRLKFLKAWDHLDEEEKREETDLALRQAEKALEWAAEIAHAVNGPQLSKGIINAMLHELGVIPEIPKQ